MSTRQRVIKFKVRITESFHKLFSIPNCLLSFCLLKTEITLELLHDYNYIMFKIIVIGNSAVGKTSIVNRFVGDRFDHNYKATIAADFQVKILNLQGNEIRLQIWDLVGMDTNFAGINRSFCRNASGAILVGDITDQASIEATAEWKEQVEEIISAHDSPIPMILAVNKADLCREKEERGLELEEW